MCGSSVSASPTFVLFDAVLAVPEGNVMMYDGSSSQWNQYSVAKIKAAGATRRAGEHLGLRRRRRPGRPRCAPSARCPPPVAGENPFVPGNFVYSPTQAEMNQIEAADKAYMAKTGGGRAAAPPAAAPPAAAAEARRTAMTSNTLRNGLLLTLSLALLAAPLLAQEKEAMTAPPWGDAGAKIHFGEEDQGTLQLQYKAQFRLNYRDIGSGTRRRRTARPTSASAATGSP